MKAVIKYVLLSTLVLFISCTKKSTETTTQKNNTDKITNQTEVYYTCSMHPKIKEKEDGRCPICHMNLTKVEIEHSDENHKISQVEKTKKVTNKKSKEDIEVYYTCSMHPKIKEKEDGKCPICHMNLTRVEVDHSESDHIETSHSEKNSAEKVIGRIKLKKISASTFLS